MLKMPQFFLILVSLCLFYIDSIKPFFGETSTAATSHEDAKLSGPTPRIVIAPRLLRPLRIPRIPASEVNLKHQVLTSDTGRITMFPLIRYEQPVPITDLKYSENQIRSALYNRLDLETKKNVSEDNTTTFSTDLDGYNLLIGIRNSKGEVECFIRNSFEKYTVSADFYDIMNQKYNLEQAAINPTKETLTAAIGQGYLAIVKKMLKRLVLNQEDLKKYNKLLQFLYSRKQDPVYKSIGQVLRKYALNKLTLYDIARTMHRPLPEEIAGYIVSQE